MRLSCISLCLALMVAGSLTARGDARAASGPSEEAVSATIDALVSRIGELEAEVVELRGRLAELEKQAAAAEEAEEEAELADLLAAAEQEAAEEAAPEPEEEVTFTSGALGLQSLNPEISVTGDFISSYRSGEGVARPFDNTVRTLGLHLESYLDPYSRFKAAIPVTDDKAKIGEAYFTRYGWLPSLNVTLGRFRQQFGVVNRWHKHGLDQIDFPLPLRQIFGPGGLNQTGGSVEWQMPPSGSASQELTFQVTDGENPRVFAENTRNHGSFLAHYKNYRDLSKDTYLEIGATGLLGRNDTWSVLGPGGIISQRDDLWSDALGIDVTVLWEPTEAMRYRNWLWRTEAYWLDKDILAPDGSGRDSIQAWGAYTNYQAKLNRTTEAGIRVDYYEPDAKSYAAVPGLSLAPLAVTECGARQWLFAPYVTWWQSPWVRWRLEWDHLDNKGMGADEDVLYLQCTYAAGPHKHERY
jgi:hypothetical protein